MRVESLTSRLEFNERRARALESVVAYKPDVDEEPADVGTLDPTPTRHGTRPASTFRIETSTRPPREPDRSQADRPSDRQARPAKGPANAAGGADAAAAVAAAVRRPHHGRTRLQSGETMIRFASSGIDVTDAAGRFGGLTLRPDASSERRAPVSHAHSESNRGRRRSPTTNPRRAAQTSIHSEARGRRPALRPGDQRRRRTARAIRRRASRAPRRGRGPDDLRDRLRHLAKRAARRRRTGQRHSGPPVSVST